MSEINYFKFFLYYVRWCDRWYGPVVYRGYKLMDDMTIDNVDSLHVRRIGLNNW
jgi:hypothetical protein